jgi:cell division protein FtsB
MTLNTTKNPQNFAMQTSRKPRVILVLLTALCGLFVFSYTSRLAQKSELEAQISVMQARIAEARNEQFMLQEELAKRNQPDYLDWVARNIFGWVMPGDTLLVIVDESQRGTAGALSPAWAAANPIDYRNFPVWQQWVVFFTADAFTISLQ